MRAYCHGNQSRLQPTTLLPATPCHPFATLSLSRSTRPILSSPIYIYIVYIYIYILYISYIYISAISFSSDEFREKMVKIRHVRSFFSRQQDREKEGEKFLLRDDSLFFGIFFESCSVLFFFFSFKLVCLIFEKNCVTSEKFTLSQFFDSVKKKEL